MKIIVSGHENGCYPVWRLIQLICRTLPHMSSRYGTCNSQTGYLDYRSTGYFLTPQSSTNCDHLFLSFTLQDLHLITRIVYVSRALSPTHLEIKNIFLAAKKNNPVSGVTGALCSLDGIYLQYLEGEAFVVGTLYDKIRVDSRHKDARLLVHDQVPKRTYPKWPMALLTWNDEMKAIFNSFNPDSVLDAYATNPASVISLLQTWSRTPNWTTSHAPH